MHAETEPVQFIQCTELNELNLNRVDDVRMSNVYHSLEKLTLDTCTIDFADMSSEMKLTQLVMNNCRLTSKFPWHLMTHLTRLELYHTITLTKRQVTDLFITCPQLTDLKLSGTCKNVALLLLSLIRTPFVMRSNLKTLCLSFDNQAQQAVAAVVASELDQANEDKTSTGLLQSNIRDLTLSELWSLTKQSFDSFFQSGIFYHLSSCSLSHCRGLTVSHCIRTLSKHCPNLYQLQLHCTLLGTRRIDPSEMRPFKKLYHCCITENDPDWRTNAEVLEPVVASILACTYDPERVSCKEIGSYYFSCMDNLRERHYSGDSSRTLSDTSLGFNKGVVIDDQTKQYQELLNDAIAQFARQNWS